MKDVILISDSNKKDREELKAILKDEYEIIEAEDCTKTIEMLENRLDVISAAILGFPHQKIKCVSFLDFFEKNNFTSKIPVLVICSREDSDILYSCFDSGIPDFIAKPFEKIIIHQRLRTVISLYRNMKKAENVINEQTEELQRKNKILNETNEKIIELLGNVIEARNLESGAHIRRVKDFTRIIATDVKENYPQYGLTQQLINDIVSASALHDIGKILIPDSILLKPAKLTPEEYEIMKTHTTKGSELLEGAREIWGDEYADMCKNIALYHHERYDGNGYPCGLKGDEIPISAQIVSIADVYDALVTHRVYKDPYEPEVAYEMIVRDECGKFSDLITESFKRQKNNLERLLGEEKCTTQKMPSESTV